MCFEKEVVQGFLKKRPQSKKMFGFGQQLIQRYFILDHKSETMQIFEKNEPTSPSKLYHYSEVIDLNDLTYFNSDPKNGNTVKPRWSFNFVVKCKHRDFELFSASEDEKQMWLHAFN